MKVFLDVTHVTPRLAREIGYLEPGHYVTAWLNGQIWIPADCTDTGYAGHCHGHDGCSTRARAIERALTRVHGAFPGHDIEFA